MCTQKVLAVSYYVYNGSIRSADFFDSRIGSSAVHIYFVLVMIAILGISAFYHDSAAALVVDGEIISAAQEERFTRKKHDASYPVCAIDYVLSCFN